MFIFLIILTILTNVSKAEAPPIIIKDKSYYQIGLNLDILEDPKNKLTINDVNSPKCKSGFL